MPLETRKVKSPAKIVVPHGRRLDAAVLGVAASISRVVGSTLGPGGRPVLLERQEYGIAPTVTKDGVSVFRALGYQDPVAHLVCESMRDTATRTVNEAGDGTTTATVLAEALLRRTLAFCREHPGEPKQAVVAAVRKAAEEAETVLRRLRCPTVLGTEEGDRLLHAVAAVSANGDTELADAVMEAFGICGDMGNVAIFEQAGNPSGYRVERVDGYQLDVGYEDAIGKPAMIFVNSAETQQVLLDKPAFILYFGAIRDLQTIKPALERLQDAWGQGYLKTPNVVVAATAWGDRVIEALAHNWANSDSINVFPLTIPLTALQSSQRQTLDDLAAVVAAYDPDNFRSVPATVFDPNTRPLSEMVFEDLGNLAQDPETKIWKPRGVYRVEVGRHRTAVLGVADPDDPDTILARADVVKRQEEQAASQLDRLWHRDRLAKLTGGIARLTVVGASHGELKERRDRADDAVCAVAAAVRRATPDAEPNGCLPGAGWALLAVAHYLAPGLRISFRASSPVREENAPQNAPQNASQGPSATLYGVDFDQPHNSFEFAYDRSGTEHDPVRDVLVPALLEPAIRVMENVGVKPEVIAERVNAMLDNADLVLMQLAVPHTSPHTSPHTYDASTGAWVSAYDHGLVDSYPAVAQALSNAASIGALLGTIGAVVVTPRDNGLERDEARDAYEWDRMANYSVDDRG